MTTSVDLLRSFAASVCLTLGLARLAEKLDPSALAAGTDAAIGIASLPCINCDVTTGTLIRSCLLTMPCSVPVRAAVPCVGPCAAPVKACMPCTGCGLCEVPVRAS